MNLKKFSKFSFKSEDLVVDYITFKFQDLNNLQQTRITNYLFKLGFNSYQQSGKLAQPIKESLRFSSKNKFEVSFVIDNSYWQGTLLNFPGLNANHFYTLVKSKSIDWRIFSSAVLSRFDLYFSRNNKTDDKIEVIEFLHDCNRKLNLRKNNVSLEKNQRGLILKIGSRKSNHYSRIYQNKNKNSLRFEYEMKGKFLQDYHSLLVDHRLEEFEQKLSSHFLVYFGKLLPLHFSYLDWLVIKLRPISKRPKLPLEFNSDYIHSQILMDKRSFVSLIQFLNYAQHLDFKIDYLGSTSYRKVVFKLRDFIKYQDPSVKSTNRYRLRKIKEFFQQLQAGLYVTSFSDLKFQSLVLVPKVQIDRCPKQKFLIGKVWLVEELFYYNYPFYLPDLFKQKLTKDDFEVLFKFIQTFQSVHIEKEFFIQEFLSSYSSLISNQRIRNIKKYFIKYVQYFKELNLIEDNYKIINNGYYYSSKELNTHNISEGFVIYEKLYV